MFKKYVAAISVVVLFISIFFMGKIYIEKDVLSEENGLSNIVAEEISQEIFSLGNDYKNIIEEKNKNMNKLFEQINKKNDQINKFQDRIISDKTSVQEAKKLRTKNNVLQDEVNELENELTVIKRTYHSKELKYVAEIKKLKTKIKKLEKKVKENKSLHKQIDVLESEISVYKIFNDSYIKIKSIKIDFLSKKDIKLHLIYKNVKLLKKLSNYDFYLEVKIFPLNKNGKKKRIFNKSANIFNLELGKKSNIKHKFTSTQNLFTSGNFLFEIETIDKKSNKRFKFLKVWCEKQMLGEVKILKTEQRNVF